MNVLHVYWMSALLLCGPFCTLAQTSFTDLFSDLDDVPLPVSVPEIRPSTAASVEEMPLQPEPEPIAQTPTNRSLAQIQFPEQKRSIRYTGKTNSLLLKPIAKEAVEESGSYPETRATMLEDVRSAWNTPSRIEKKPECAVTQHQSTESERDSAALCAKMKTIRIPSVHFQNADIQQVIHELSILCQKLDPEKKGINFAVFGSSETRLPPITFSGTDLSALETLDIITQMSGMKYDMDPHVVRLTPFNYEPPQQMISAEFDVLPSVGRKIMMRLGEELMENGHSIDVSGFFSAVPFPVGASVQYNPEFNILLVRNVPKNIEIISSLLDRYVRKALEERSQQVEIETKFIEVSQGALEELGVEWTLGTPGKNISSDSWTLPGGQHLFTDTLRQGEDVFSTPIAPFNRPTTFNQYGQPLNDSIESKLLGTAGELMIKKVKGNLKVDLLIRALERTTGADLLSAPKILVISGETAHIHIGETHSFPTAYEVEIDRYVQPSLVPLDYEEEKTGVILKVTPEIDQENRTIILELDPEIRELIGFDVHHVSTLWPFFSSGNNNAFDIIAPDLSGVELGQLMNTSQGSADRLIARSPIFRTRKVHTVLSIENGSTIVMGGLIKEQRETFKDSVPILGKIPFLGRLFRSEGERNVKRNLLIFVTANRVDASGYRKAKN